MLSCTSSTRQTSPGTLPSPYAASTCGPPTDAVTSDRPTQTHRDVGGPMDPKKMIEKTLKELKRREVVIGPRRDYNEGRHPSLLGSGAWRTSFRERLWG